jgi:hypothetical protein
MGADCIAAGDDGDEVWSNWICPHCHGWFRLEDYEPVASRGSSTETA